MKNQINKSFLSLPAEIRLEIYEAALIMPFEIEATFRKRMDQTVLIPGDLLLTCKQIHSEAKDILYSQNTFHASDKTVDTDGIEWLSRIGPRNAQHIRFLTLSINHGISSVRGEESLLRYLRKLKSVLTDLQELTFWIAEHNWEPSFQTLLQFSWGDLKTLAPFRKIIVGGYWHSLSIETFHRRCKHCNFDFGCIDLNSFRWEERESEKTVQRRKMAEEAAHVRHLTNKRKIDGWADANAKVRSDWRKLENGLWRMSCPCSECLDKREVSHSHHRAKYLPILPDSNPDSSLPQLTSLSGSSPYQQPHTGTSQLVVYPRSASQREGSSSTKTSSSDCRTNTAMPGNIAQIRKPVDDYVPRLRRVQKQMFEH